MKTPEELDWQIKQLREILQETPYHQKSQRQQIRRHIQELTKQQKQLNK